MIISPTPLHISSKMFVVTTLHIPGKEFHSSLSGKVISSSAKSKMLDHLSGEFVFFQIRNSSFLWVHRSNQMVSCLQDSNQVRCIQESRPGILTTDVLEMVLPKLVLGRELMMQDSLLVLNLWGNIWDFPSF